MEYHYTSTSVLPWTGSWVGTSLGWKLRPWSSTRRSAALAAVEAGGARCPESGGRISDKSRLRNFGALQLVATGRGLQMVHVNWGRFHGFSMDLSKWSNPIGSMYGIYGNIYHQYTPNVSIYTIHGSYGNGVVLIWLSESTTEPMTLRMLLNRCASVGGCHVALRCGVWCQQSGSSTCLDDRAICWRNQDW